MPSPCFTRCPILYEDRWLVAVNKPDGMVSHPNSRGPEKPERRISCAFAGAYDGGERRFDTPEGPLWLLHRLDQDTSGVLLAARDAVTAAALRAQFESQAIRKTYLALVAGRPSPPSGLWRDHLEKRRFQHRVRSQVRTHRPPNAELRYATQKTFPAHRLVLLEITLLTGRTHQIRVQAATRRHPVAGDRIYGDFSLNRELRRSIGLRRLFLHAWRVQFNHPHSRQPVTIEAPLPEELATCLRDGSA
jgi:RluA family pseudouridine synthase